MLFGKRKAFKLAFPKKNDRLRVRFLLLGGIGAVYVALLMMGIFGNTDPSAPRMNGRALSSATTDCDVGNWPLIIGMLVAILYLFLGLAVICDDFFVPSLEAITTKLQLSEDVAGATFMAAGSSAPELFTSVADSFGSQNSIGIGTIVGSAMFNILVIVALAASVSHTTLKIDWRPLARDVFFYSSSIGILFIVFNDAEARWYEGGIMVAVYGLYIVFMVFNQRIFSMCAPKDYKVQPENEKDAIEVIGGVMQQQAGTGETPEFAPEAPVEAPAAEEGGEKAEDKKEEEEEIPGLFEFPKEDGCFDKFLWIMSLPYNICFTFTVPHCQKHPKLYLVSFGMSILWIGAICLGMVFMASDVGCMLNIAPPVMGIVVLAVGTSVPDALGSMIVARNGEADMAIANAVGSNVFDILLGLGVPWFAAGLIKGPQPVDRDGIEVGVLILFGTVLLFVGSIMAFKFHMHSNLGWLFLFAYVMYIAFTILSESCVIVWKTKCLATVVVSAATNVTGA